MYWEHGVLAREDLLIIIIFKIFGKGIYLGKKKTQSLFYIS